MKVLGGEEIRCLQNDVKNGLDIDEAINMLHQYKFTITESMKFLVTEYQIGLGDAKKLVSEHPVWREVARASKPMQDELFDEARKHR